MRNKIAKRRHRDILRLGGIITKEEWFREHTGKRKDDAILINAWYNGYLILTHGFDKLEAYQTVLECMKGVRDKPFIPSMEETNAE